MKVSAVILAAGYSSRMGEFKPLMQLGGRSVLACCAGIFRGAGVEDIVVVTGHRGEEVADEAARLGLRPVANPDHDEGMFSSVCRAVADLQPRKMDGFFLLPVDIPLIYPATVAALLDAFDGSSVVFPVFDGERGHPPLIPARLIPAIQVHDGHGGLATLLATEAHCEVAVWDRGTLLDADRPEDFAALVRRAARMDIGDPDEAMALARLMMPEKGVAHGLGVARVAVALGREINRHGAVQERPLDLDLLFNAGLLHDIAKGGPNHEARGAEMLSALGLFRLAPIVAAHRDARLPQSGALTEKELVCLADKLVRGRSRVPIEQRFEEKLRKYAGDPEACRAIRGRLATAQSLRRQAERAAGRPLAEILDAEMPS